MLTYASRRARTHALGIHTHQVARARCRSTGSRRCWGEKVLVYGTFSSPVSGKVDECRQVHGEMSGAKTLPCTLATPCHVIQKMFANPLRNLFFLHSICALTNTFTQWWNMLGCLPLAVNQLELMLCIILQNVRSSAAFKAELMADEVTKNHMPDLLWCLEMVKVFVIVLSLGVIWKRDTVLFGIVTWNTTLSGIYNYIYNLHWKRGTMRYIKMGNHLV